VLQQNTFHNQKGELCIRLGEASARYNPRFRLLVTTRLRSPRFPFNVVRNLVVCNFSITKAQVCCMP
jgi:dynein heavy chain